MNKLILLFLVSCASQTPVVVVPPVPVIPPIHVIPDPDDELFDDGEELMIGWSKSYDGYIKRVIKEELPKLLTIEPSRMSKVCPKWAGFDELKRLDFYANLLWSIAGPESEWHRNLIYLEDTMSIDPITGYQVRSEGLLQLSFQDLDSYNYPHQDISWAADKATAIAEYKSHEKYGNPNRTILKARPNLHLGLWIMNKHLNQFNTNSEFYKNLGAYWWTCNPSHNEEVVANMHKKMPSCF